MNQFSFVWVVKKTRKISNITAMTILIFFICSDWPVAGPPECCLLFRGDDPQGRGYSKGPLVPS
jgi:hypothetical protein